MTRTFRLSVDKAERHARLARLFTKARDESRAVYYSAREAHAIYQSESRAVRRAALAADMANATTRDYPADSGDHGDSVCIDPRDLEPGDYPECARCSESHAGCIGNSDITCYVHERYQAGAR